MFLFLPAANLCADMVRAALKEPVKSKAKIRETIYFRQSLWKGGVPQKQGEAASRVPGARLRSVLGEHQCRCCCGLFCVVPPQPRQQRHGCCMARASPDQHAPGLFACLCLPYACSHH